MSVTVDKNENVLHVSWTTYADNFRQLMAELMGGTEFSDVTLVCDDKKEIQAHKFLLSTCSPVFKNILSKNPKNLPVYLKGTQSEDVVSLLQFMYLGEATVPQERMESFFKFANFFRIKDLSEYTENEKKKKEAELEKVRILEKKSLEDKKKDKKVKKPRTTKENIPKRSRLENDETKLYDRRPTMSDWAKEVGNMMKDINETLEQEREQELMEDESSEGVEFIDKVQGPNPLTEENHEDEVIDETQVQENIEVFRRKRRKNMPKSNRHEVNELNAYLDNIQNASSDSSHLLSEDSDTFSKFFDISDLCGDEIYKEPEKDPNDPKKYICKWCNGERGRFKNATERTFEDLSEHFRTAHKAQGPLFACNKCDYQDKGIDQLSDHCKRMHTNRNTDANLMDLDDPEPAKDDHKQSNNILCPKCDKKYSTATLLGSHLMREHKPKKDLTCQWCGIKFFKDAELIPHVKTVHKGYVCSAVKCSYQANSLDRFQAHIKSSHTNSNPCKYVCSDCDFENNSLSRFIEHVNRHHSTHQESDQEDVDCDEVELEEEIAEEYKKKRRRAMKNFALNEDINLTAGQYNCRLCELGFSEQLGLNLHIRKDHEKLTASCDLCSTFKYYSEAAVKMHKMAKH